MQVAHARGVNLFKTCRLRDARGVTRIELLLGLVTLSLVAAFIALWSSGQREDVRRDEATRSARALLEAATEWKREHGSAGCPTISLLKHEERYDKSAPADDPWGERFRISCESGAVRVRSAGSDRRFETDDDVSVLSDGNS
jgi:type II secretory pathway pseudopilin PulG